MRRRTFLALGAASLLLSAGRALAVTDPFPGQSEAEDRDNFPISRDEYILVKPQYRPQIVSYSNRERPGTIIIDTRRRYLYRILNARQAKRYGVGVGRRGFEWAGTAMIGRKAKWPTWNPPKEMMERDLEAAKWPNGMPGGPKNPLGARALYLYQDGTDTLYRIHGTREPKTIGRAVSSGCIRMLNADVSDLFEATDVGTKVVVVGPSRPMLVKSDAWAKPLVEQPKAYWKQFKREFKDLLNQIDRDLRR
jgi:lipoprotein-anchoring transpeptidase ErfK/SrfK